MKKRKSLLSAMLALTLMFSMSGCGTASSSTPQESTEPSTESASIEADLRTVTLPDAKSLSDAYKEVKPSEETEASTEESSEASTEATEEESTEEVKDTPYSRSGKPAVALTFDDGPRSGSTDRILDVLEEYNAHATFFIVGQNVNQNPDALKREVELGCELGTHTWDHSDLAKLSSEQVSSQMTKSITAIEEASGGEVTVMRPPYGSIDAEVKELLELPIILWSLDTLDWKTRDAAATCDTIKENIKGGDIILMHDIHAETADAVEEIVPWLVENGYELLTVTELYEYYGEDLSLHKGHGSAQ